jgi:acyl-CoA reductase-like NAD-dependent aldehyde dehydrogenase
MLSLCISHEHRAITFFDHQFPAGEIPLLALPALGAGNTVIVKPSEVAPRTGALYTLALASALPDGVLQVVQGDGSVGEQLVSSDDVHMIAMTGSSATGKRIMEKSAKNLKRLVLELGGKDPMVVFADADLDKAAEDAVANSVFNAGQVCCAVERIYIENSVKPEFEQKVVELAKKQKVGIPTEEGVTMGPMVSQMQLEIVQKQVEDSIANGAKKLYESEVPEGGNFFPVTVLTDLTQDMLIQKTETFGPVIAMSAFDGTEEDAVKLANDTEYGLASYVYTGDLVKASRVARKIKSGQVGINCYSLIEAQPKCPW